MHQPVEEANKLHVSKSVEVAVREKTKLLCEYFIYLSLYHDNGVNITYGSNHKLHRIKHNEYLLVKRRQLTINTAMVYLLDKHIDYHNFKISSFNVKWGTSYEYDENCFLTIEIDYDTKGEPTYYSIEVCDYTKNKHNLVIFDNNNISIYVNGLLSEFFNEVDRIFKLFVSNRNKYVLDKVNKEYSEKIGDPRIHMPIETS